jgi:hypothetical protein
MRTTEPLEVTCAAMTAAVREVLSERRPVRSGN